MHSLTSGTEKVMGADMGIGVGHNSKPHHSLRADDEHWNPIRKLVCTHHIVSLSFLFMKYFEVQCFWKKLVNGTLFFTCSIKFWNSLLIRS